MFIGLILKSEFQKHFCSFFFSFSEIVTHFQHENIVKGNEITIQGKSLTYFHKNILIFSIRTRLRRENEFKITPLKLLANIN